MTDKHPQKNSQDTAHKTSDQKTKPDEQNNYDEDQEQMHQTGTSNHETTKDPNDDIQDLRRGNKTP